MINSSEPIGIGKSQRIHKHTHLQIALNSILKIFFIVALIIIFTKLKVL